MSVIKLIGRSNTLVFKFFGAVPLIVSGAAVVYYLSNNECQHIFRFDLLLFLFLGGCLCSYRSSLYFENNCFSVASEAFGLKFKRTRFSYANKLYVDISYSQSLYSGSGTPSGRSYYCLYLKGKYDDLGCEVSRFFDRTYYVGNKNDFTLFSEKVREVSSVSNFSISYSQEVSDIHKGYKG